MWQRFTERARKVVFYAQEESRRYGACYVGTEHLLLGLLRGESDAAVKALAELGIMRDSVRTATEAQMPPPDSRPVQDMTLTPRSKRAIELASEEATSLGDYNIGPEHILLGLLGVEGSPAQRVLASLGVQLEACRDIVVAANHGVSDDE